MFCQNLVTRAWKALRGRGIRVREHFHSPRLYAAVAGVACCRLTAEKLTMVAGFAIVRAELTFEDITRGQGEASDRGCRPKE